MADVSNREADSDERAAVAVFSPALLLSIELHLTSEGLDEVHLHAGGQGYWVSKMIAALGGEPIPCAPVGGEAGDALCSIIAADGLDARLTRMNNSNAVIIEDRRNGKRHTLVETPFPALGRHEVDELYSTIVGAALAAGVCVLAGTQLAAMFDHDTFRRLVVDLRRHRVVVVADLSGEPLNHALAGGVDIVKVSHDELVRDGWASSGSRRSVIEGMSRLRDAGASAVVVSRRERSTLASTDDGVFEVRSPNLEVLDGRGGGDSMTAALATAASRGVPFVDGLRLAAAAAALNVSRHGLGTGRRDAIEDVAGRVEVVAIESTDPVSTSTRAELYQRARDLDIPGRSTMNRKELLAALASTTGP